MINSKFIMIYTGDLHFGAYKDEKRFYNEIESYFYSKIEELQDSLDVVVISGDIWHRIVSQNEDAGILATKFILKMNSYSLLYDFDLIIVKGTSRHDFNQLEPFKKLEITNDKFHIINTAQVLYLQNDITILIIPEEYVSNPDEYYREYLELDEGKYDFIVGHGTFDFAGYAGKLIESEKNMKSAPTFKSKKFKDLAYGCTLFSHIHISMEEDNVFYPGSYSRFAFGEEDCKGYYMVEYDTEILDTELTFIENELAPTYVTVDLDTIQGDIVDITSTLKELEEDYDYVRIIGIDTNHDGENANLEFLKEYQSKDKNLKVQIHNKHHHGNDVDKQHEYIIKRELSLENTIQRFIKEEKGKDVDLDIIKRAVLEDDSEEEDEE